VVDRYAYSGVAYSAAKNVSGMGREWCAAPDSGLIAPDAVIFLEILPKGAEARYASDRAGRLDSKTHPLPGNAGS